MKRARAALEAIQSNPDRAGAILADAAERGGRGFLEGLGYYLVAVLDGYIYLPEQLTARGPASSSKRPRARLHRASEAPKAASLTLRRGRPKP